MSTEVDLTDPACEPTDSDFAQLMRAAFAGLPRARAESLREMRARILEMQSAARAAFVARSQARHDR